MCAPTGRRRKAAADFLAETEWCEDGEPSPDEPVLKRAAERRTERETTRDA